MLALLYPVKLRMATLCLLHSVVISNQAIKKTEDSQNPIFFENYKDFIRDFYLIFKTFVIIISELQ